MRLLGHPVHVMVVHFPVALWPAHWALHLGAARLPAGAAGAVAFWLLAAGTTVGWLAVLAGVSDLVALSRQGPSSRLKAALVHAGLNGAVLIGFTLLAALERQDYPAIAHGPTVLTGEGVLLALLALGNHFGGRVIWESPKP
jgi:uncharacterized membrane protein